jgi:hypothetical protein
MKPFKLVDVEVAENPAPSIIRVDKSYLSTVNNRTPLLIVFNSQPLKPQKGAEEHVWT